MKSLTKLGVRNLHKVRVTSVKPTVEVRGVSKRDVEKVHVIGVTSVLPTVEVIDAIAEKVHHPLQ